MTACEGLIPSDCNNPDCPAHAADRDDLAAIIEAHEVSMDYESYRGCACSPAPYPKAPAISQQDHAAHVAQMVLESDWLRGVRAKELRDASDWMDHPDTMKPRHAPNGWLWGVLGVSAVLRDRADAEDGGRDGPN